MGREGHGRQDDRPAGFPESSGGRERALQRIEEERISNASSITEGAGCYSTLVSGQTLTCRGSAC